MNANFPRALELVLKHEGGYVDHPKDPGGATNLGITIGTLSDWLGRRATKAEVKALTKQSVAPIYRKRYWDAVRGDDLPSGLDYAVFDFAVNSGVSRASKYLQAILRVPQDGKIGPVTIAAAKAADPTILIERLCTNRMEFLEGLSTFPTFGKGWKSRVEGVLEAAFLMTISPTPPAPDYETHPEPAPQPDPIAKDTGGNLRFLAIGAVLVIVAIILIFYFGSR
jgi:lysozyme family protein